MPPEAGSAERLAVPVEKMNAMGKGPLVARACANPPMPSPGPRLPASCSSPTISTTAARTSAPPWARSSPPARTSSCTPSLSASTSRSWRTSPASRSRRAASCGMRRTPPAFASALGQAVTLANLQTDTERRRAATADAAAAPDKPAPGAPPGLYLSAGLGPTSATLDNPVHWRITKAGADGALVRDTRASSLFEKLEPGTYDVEARLGLAQRTPDGRGRGRYGDAGARRPQRRRPQDAGARRRCDAAADLRHFHGRPGECREGRRAAVGRARHASRDRHSGRRVHRHGAERPRPAAEQCDDRSRHRHQLQFHAGVGTRWSSAPRAAPRPARASPSPTA